MSKKTKSNFYEMCKKVRGDWNGLNPSTRIIPNKKKYSRKQKYKQKFEF